LAKASLTEDFDQKPLDDVLLNSNRQQKKKRRVEREKTAGNSWFSLPATELDDQRRRDLELVQMRDALDPKQHYKRPDREVLPKYFQVTFQIPLINHHQSEPRTPLSRLAKLWSPRPTSTPLGWHASSGSRRWPRS